MLRTRLASLALAAGLCLTSGCLTWIPRPCASGCCPPAGGCCDGVVAGYGGGVVGTPCCTSHAVPPGAIAGPALAPQDAGPLLGAMPLPGAPSGILAPAPNPRLVPFPQAQATPYTP